MRHNNEKFKAKGMFIPNTDAPPRTFSVCPSWQNCSYKTPSERAVDVKQNGVNSLAYTMNMWYNMHAHMHMPTHTHTQRDTDTDTFN